MDIEEGKNLLHGSIDAFDQEYDNALIKFERAREKMGNKKSIKVIWTYWFLLKSVLFPSLIPIIIALPLVYVSYQIESLYFKGLIPTSLIVFWVIAWIFLMDLIHLCHWFSFIEIPIISEQSQSGGDNPSDPVPLVNEEINSNILMSSHILDKSQDKDNNNSFFSALTIASRATSMLTPNIVDSRRTSAIPIPNNRDLLMQSRLNRRTSMRADVAIALVRRGSSFGKTVGEPQKTISKTVHAAESDTDSQVSEILLDVIPMNPDFDVADPFMQSQTNSQNENSQDDPFSKIGALQVVEEVMTEPDEITELPLIEKSDESQVHILDIGGLTQIQEENEDMSKKEDSESDGILEGHITLLPSQKTDESQNEIIKSEQLLDSPLQPQIHILENSEPVESIADLQTSSEDDEPLPEIPMNSFFASGQSESISDGVKIKTDKMANTSDDCAEPDIKILPKKRSHPTFNLKRRRTMKPIVYDPYEDDKPVVRRQSIFSVTSDSELPSGNTSDPVKDSQDVNDEQAEEELVEVLWSPLFFHMIWKFLFRWTVIPIFIFLLNPSDLVALIVYPFLVIPGSVFAHMITVTSWIYPVMARFLTSIFTVCMTEIINQCLFYSMIAPLAFIDIRLTSKTVDDAGISIAKGILKAIVFFISRNIVKYVVIYTDRRAIQNERAAELMNKKNRADQSSEKSPPEGAETGDSAKPNSLQVVYEDEIEDLQYYGQLILALGGHGVPGWIFIFRIKDNLQFSIAAAGSLLMEALMVISFKNYMDWLEKRKERKKKAEEKEKRKQERQASKLSTGLKRKGSVSPNMAAIKGIKPGKKDSKVAKRPQSVKKVVPDLTARKAAPTPAAPSAPRLSILIHQLRKDSSRSSIYPPEGANDTITIVAMAAFHQDNRRQAVERRFNMCSTYAAIIGAASVYMIFTTGLHEQSLCDDYGNVEPTVVAWRLITVLAVQFLVDWWFTLNQLIWGLPFGFTTQIKTTIVHGFLVTALAIVQSVTVLMAHERGLFGSCHRLS